MPIAAKVAAGLSGLPFVGSFVGALADLIKEHISRTSEATHREQEECLADFYTEMLDAYATTDDRVANAVVVDNSRWRAHRAQDWSANGDVGTAVRSNEQGEVPRGQVHGTLRLEFRAQAGWTYIVVESVRAVVPDGSF